MCPYYLDGDQTARDLTAAAGVVIPVEPLFVRLRAFSEAPFQSPLIKATDVASVQLSRTAERLLRRPPVDLGGNLSPLAATDGERRSLKTQQHAQRCWRRAGPRPSGRGVRLDAPRWPGPVDVLGPHPC